jgi:DHA1 family tetracycline resistance protein-like MFS transporter
MSEKRQPALVFIFITLLIDITGLGIIIPVLPKLIEEVSHSSTSEAAIIGGWLLFSFSIMQFLVSPLLGSLSDRFGRRPILLAALFGFGVDYLVMAFAPNLTWLFAGRILAGIMGASITTAMAYIADVSTPEKRAQNFGMVGAAFGLGFIIGPVLGGVLGQFGSRVPFFAAAIFSLVNFLYGYFILPESLSKENRRKFEWKRANPVIALMRLRKYPVISGLVFSLILVYLASHAVQSNWSFYTIERLGWSTAMIGYSLGVVGICVALIQGVLIRKINPYLGPKKSVLYGMIFYGIGLLCFAFSSQTWMMMASIIPYCLGGICGPAIQGIMSSQVPADEQGELQGALTSLVSATAIAGPPLMTNTFGYFTGTHSPFYFPGAPFVLAAILVALGTWLAEIFLVRYTEPPVRKN